MRQQEYCEVPLHVSAPGGVEGGTNVQSAAQQHLTFLVTVKGKNGPQCLRRSVAVTRPISYCYSMLCGNKAQR